MLCGVVLNGGSTVSIDRYSVINSNCHKVKAYLACLRTFYIKTPLVKIVPEIGKFIIELKK